MLFVFCHTADETEFFGGIKEVFFLGMIDFFRMLGEVLVNIVIELSSGIDLALLISLNWIEIILL